MDRTVTALVLVSGLAWAADASSTANADPPSPVLSGPIVDPSQPAVRTAPNLPPRVTTMIPSAAPIPERGPLLVLPGLNTPRPGTRIPSRNLAPTASPAPERPDVTLSAPLRDDSGVDISPLESSAPAPYQGPRGGNNTSRGGDPIFSENAPPSVLNSQPIGLERPSDDPTASDRTARKPEQERNPLPPRRAPGFFGRLFPSTSQPRDRSDFRDEVSVEPKTDPATDALVKRRVERSIRDKVGDRVRFYEVRVVGHDVTIHVKATRFWQKRSVRNSLDALPGLKGYKVVIDMAD